MTLGTVFKLHIVVPCTHEPRLVDAASEVVKALRLLAQGHAGAVVDILAVDGRGRRVWCAETGRSIEAGDIGAFRPRSARDWIARRWSRAREGRAALHVLANAGFLLGDPPPFDALTKEATSATAWCAAHSTRDAYACAFAPATLRSDEFWAILDLLLACTDRQPDATWDRLVPKSAILPFSSFVEHSPALAGVRDPRSRRTYDSPLFVNTALREMVSEPQFSGGVSGDPRRMATALRAHRSVSRVPWVFNTLLNDIECRLGNVLPESVPPEVHLSVTGVCNIECRFCAYEHHNARRDFVEPAQITHLDFLQYAQTFRLHSGLGEPTANKHLPAIVQCVAERFPHLGMNFFTNALRLNRAGLTDALVGRVRWINSSLNAANRESWKDQCDGDFFDTVVNNLRALHRAKQERGSLLPLVFASTVLTRATVGDLPSMPALCRTLGIDRFSAFPYFGLGYHGRNKYGPDMTLESCRAEYDDVYWRTVEEAHTHDVSIEMPLPSGRKRTAFGLEARTLYDFARVESNEWKLGRFVQHLDYGVEPNAYCPVLWRSAGIGSTHNGSRAVGETHYLYPCIGPLSGVDFSTRMGFRFPGTDGFQQLWRNPVFTLLRRAQHERGVSHVCDHCRAADTRHPGHFATLERLVAEFATEHCPSPAAPVQAVVLQRREFQEPVETVIPFSPGHHAKRVTHGGEGDLQD